ncbi:MAG: NUDIX domain-containing protein [Clostridia bacterium]|nr:NUDIX domain-containing protein [Clostridia bacterium]
MEYLDILDSNGNKTGKIKSRNEVHSKGYWHKGVHIWIINSKRELLVQRRSANKDVYPNKLYISVAGHPTSGEEEIESIKREFFEEIGVELDISKLEYLFTFSQEVIENDGKFLDNQFYDVYLIELDLDINNLKLQKDEVSEVKNIYYKDFEQMIMDKNKDIVNHPEEWKYLFKILHKRYD